MRADLQKFLATPRSWSTMAEIQKFDYPAAPILLDALRRAGIPEGQWRLPAAMARMRNLGRPTTAKVTERPPRAT